MDDGEDTGPCDDELKTELDDCLGTADEVLGIWLDVATSVCDVVICFVSSSILVVSSWPSVVIRAVVVRAVVARMVVPVDFGSSGTLLVSRISLDNSNSW